MFADIGIRICCPVAKFGIPPANAWAAPELILHKKQRGYLMLFAMTFTHVDRAQQRSRRILMFAGPVMSRLMRGQESILATRLTLVE